MLAFVGEDRKSEILRRQRPLSSHTSTTITDVEELNEELVTIRDQGVAFNREERLEGMRAVAAPVQNRTTGDMLGALAVAGPASRFEGQYFEEKLPELIEQHAQQIGINITFS